MHPTTLRRLLVLGVCVVGVSCLHLAFGAPRAPHLTTGPRPPVRPSPRVATTLLTDASAPTSPRPAPTRPAPDRTTAEGQTGQPVQPRPAASATVRRLPPRGSTPFRAEGPKDEVAPMPVPRVTSGATTSQQLTVTWPAASDNVGVVAYQVLLDGYEVATTPTTSATVRWFNDGATDHVVQVRAVDAAGNQSLASPTLLVERPGPSASARPTPSPGPESASPVPPSPSASAPWTDDQPTAPSGAAEETPVTPVRTPRPTTTAGVR